ncbi:V8-like Glu-specific endopeptidase [Phytophthora megakarya]|uniref:Serine protease n=1 Tax=Phytophthora megakarya TaxID=4795 RepID=A0A225VVA1_9STRA|nr:V8-like Glu-specific endopeptidase [Phytophthora megakarya]
MHSLLLPRFQRRRQTRHALSIWLLWCIILSVIAHGGNSFNTSSIRKHLQQRPVKSADQPSPSIPAQHEVRRLSIFGKDGRRQVSDPTSYPYTTVGLLRWNTNVVCTGTLVASNMVLTAAECVLDSNGELRDTSNASSTFTLPQTTQAQTATVTRVHKQSDFWTKWTQNTYVLVELDEELGTRNGILHLPTAKSFEQDKPMNVQLVGYGSNLDAGECFQLCTIHFPSEINGPEYMIHHDCDVSAKRSPGSPMLIRSTDLITYAVGIHTNAIGVDPIEDNVTKTYPSYNDTAANRGVLGSFVQPQLSYLLQQIASPSTVKATDAPENNTPSSSSSSLFAGSASNSHSQEQNDQQDAGSASSSASSSSASVSSPQLGIAATAAYSCIGLVCASWIAIIFVAARRIRANR